MNGSSKRPQLSPDELQQVRWLLGGVLTLLAVWTVFYMGVEAWTLMALTTGVTAAALIWPTFPAKVPTILHTLAFPAIVGFFSVDLWINGEILPAMVRLDMLLLLYRNISYRQRRDDLQIIILGLFLVVVAGVLTVSLLFAAQLLVYTACALAFLFVITISDKVGRAAPETPATTDGNPPPRVKENPPSRQIPSWATHVGWPSVFRRLRQAADWRVAALGVILFFGVVGISALLFLAIPRFQLENSMFLDRFISKKARSGFSDTIKFGEVTEIQQDTSVALSVDLSDYSRVPAAPYWRMLVLDDYRDGTFRLSPMARAFGFNQGERTGQRVTGEVRGGRGTPGFWTFYLESGVSRYLPLLGHFEMLQFRESQNYRRAPELNVIALRAEPVAMTAYRVEGFRLADTLPDRAFAERWRTRNETTKERTLFMSRAVSETDAADLERLVAEAIGETRTLPAPEFAQRVGEWLRANHSYTLSPRIPTGPGDVLVRWVASREAGHCELFAGAFVLLARTAGFPARVVTGFKGGSWNGYSGNFTIRNSDAHAWAEIFDADAGGWLRVDPLDASSDTQASQVQGEAALAGRLDRSWSARLDSLRVFWYRRIVNFDQRSQTETLRTVKEVTQASGRRLRETLERAIARAKAWIMQPWNSRRWTGVAGVILALAGFGWLWREFGGAWWRGLRRGARGKRGGDPVRFEAGRWLRRIEEIGLPGGELEQARTELQRLRFGPRTTWPESERVFRQVRRAVRAARRGERIRNK